MVTGLGKLIKILLLVTNFIIFVGGLILVALGVWTFLDKSYIENLLGTDQYIVSISILILVGALIAIISLIGSLGAYKEIRCMLITFFVILVMILLVILAATVLAYLFRNEMDERMQTEMFNSIKLYEYDYKVTESWDLVQTSFNCCGVVLFNNLSEKTSKAYISWLSNSKFHAPLQDANVESVPWSCCKVNSNLNKKDSTQIQANCQANFPEEIHQNDCYVKLKDYVRHHLTILGAIALIISTLILLGVIFSCTLFCLIK